MPKSHNFKIKKIGRADSNESSRFYHIINWLIVGAILTITIYVLQTQTSLFQASLISVDLAPEFDGTTQPLKKAPDYVKLTEAERKLPYNALPAEKLVDLPVYNPSQLLVATASLTWGKREDDLVRNAQITYSVPYLGNYELDGVEGAGSHPGIDIKAPVGTPVYAIANGIVVRMSTTATAGFGKYILLGHKKAPSFDDPTVRETLYSLYAHLSQVNVKEGDIIKKADLIGEVGQTGLASTPHLHFQMERDTVDWHPYWPFTSSEIQAAGLSFMAALNSGFGKDNALKNTINPMKYVQKYLSFSQSSEPETMPKVTESVTSSDPALDAGTNSGQTATSGATEITPPVTIQPLITTGTVATTEPTTSPVKDTRLGDNITDLNSTPSPPTNLNFVTFNFSHQASYKLGDSIFIDITAVNDQGEAVSNPNFTGDLTLHLSDPAIGALNYSSLSATAFAPGRATLVVISAKTGSFFLTLNGQGKEYKTENIMVTDSASAIKNLDISHDGSFVMGTPEEITVSLLDEKGKPVVLPESQDSVKITILTGQATLEPAEILTTQFNLGQAKIKLTPQTEDEITIQAKLSDLVVQSKPFKHGLFTDITENSEHFAAIKFLKEKGVIGGYPDGSFQSDKTVSRVEALKFIFKALNIPTSDKVSLRFPDTSPVAWYSGFVAAADELDIVNGYADGTFRPDNTVIKVEFLKMLIEASKVDVDPIVTENPYADVNRLEWYASYVQFAKNQGWVEVDLEQFNPATDMSRGEVAEVMYRVLRGEK